MKNIQTLNATVLEKRAAISRSDYYLAYIGVQMISVSAAADCFDICTAWMLGHLSIHFLLRFGMWFKRKLGKENARLLIICAAVINLFMALCFYFISLLPYDQNAGGSESLDSEVLTPVWRITIAFDCS
jgi:uncharacterized PurR-regulated membrane protein YhhQ (DUF165 family)